MRSDEEKSGGSNISSSGGSNNSNCNSNGNTEEEEDDEDEDEEEESEEEEDRLRSAWGAVSAALCNAASGTFTARSTRTLAPVRVSATLRL